MRSIYSSKYYKKVNVNGLLIASFMKAPFCHNSDEFRLQVSVTVWEIK